jgi:hypothetical protein
MYHNYTKPHMSSKIKSIDFTPEPDSIGGESKKKKKLHSSNIIFHKHFFYIKWPTVMKLLFLQNNWWEDIEGTSIGMTTTLNIEVSFKSVLKLMEHIGYKLDL